LIRNPGSAFSTGGIHDNGKHKGFDPNNPRYGRWDCHNKRIHPGRAYPVRRYKDARKVFLARGIEYRMRRVTRYDNSTCLGLL